MFFGGFYNEGQKVLEAEDGLGEVWISGYDFAHNIEKLQQNKIGAVCSGVDLSFKYPENISQKKFDLDDSSTQKVEHTYAPAYEFIEEQRKKTNVLVHCAAGISRCSMLLSSYMMKKYNKDFESCLKIIKAARPCCQPNMGFTKQLKIYEASLGLVPKN